MKFSVNFLGLTAFVASASAQYFSDGWAPGQPATTTIPTASSSSKPSPSPTSAPTIGSLFDLSNILSSDPFASLFARVGVNITDKLGAARAKAKFWDDRIPLITDDNYGSLIVNETMTEDEENERVWFIVMQVFDSLICNHAYHTLQLCHFCQAGWSVKISR